MANLMLYLRSKWRVLHWSTDLFDTVF